MYHPSVTSVHHAKLEASTGLRIVPSPLPLVEERTASLTPKDPSRVEKGKPSPSLTADERTFIRNERLLSKIDFGYWVSRYARIDLSGSAGGGVGPVRWWKSQTIVLDRIAEAERDSFAALSRGDPVEGCKLVDHKSRQLGGTTLSRLITIHRLTLWENQRMLAGSQDEPGVLKLYAKDKLIFDNLPWWMRPSIAPSDGGYDVKGSHVQTARTNSYILYQHSQQNAGVGIGSQFDVAHLTECSSWAYPAEDIEHHFFPTVAQPSVWTVCILESTAQGLGDWWNDFTERVRDGREPGWRYVFVPWYAEDTLYRRQPPPDWTPTERTILHARKVEETSPEFLRRRVILRPDQLYWYETTRQAAAERGTLNLFLTDYACVSGDTRISTSRGLMCIKDCASGMEVESGHVSAWLDRGVKDTLVIKTHNGRRLRVTPDHLVFTTDGVVAAADLVPHQRILLAPPVLPEVIHDVEWHPIARQTNTVHIDEDIGRFLGYFMGDGCFYDNTVSIACSGRDEDVVQDVARLMELIIGRPAGFDRRPGTAGGCSTVRLGSVHWKPLLTALGAIRRYPGNKGGWTRRTCVPEAIFRSPAWVVRQFLSGLFESDGHAYPYWARTTLSAKDPKFLADVQLLLLGFGINGMTKPDSLLKRGTNVYQNHLLALGAAASDLFHERIGFISERKRGARVGVAGRDTPDRRRRPHELIDVVTSIEPAGVTHVYDLTVDGAHRYGANGILVHNCTPEESFQHSGQSAFSTELLERLSLHTAHAVPYDLEDATMLPTRPA